MAEAREVFSMFSSAELRQNSAEEIGREIAPVHRGPGEELWPDAMQWSPGNVEW
jgi:hypothetical protein